MRGLPTIRDASRFNSRFRRSAKAIWPSRSSRKKIPQEMKSASPCARVQNLRSQTRRNERCGAQTMIVKVNGEPREIPEGLTVAALLQHLGMSDGRVAIERNLDIL